jgi:malate dehydrogenase (quinone)
LKFRRLDIAAAESSDAWNNAGTGILFCELIPLKVLMGLLILKAISIAESLKYLVSFGLFSRTRQGFVS